jgi:hypothetical protein
VTNLAYHAASRSHRATLIARHPSRHGDQPDDAEEATGELD